MPFITHEIKSNVTLIPKKLLKDKSEGATYAVLKYVMLSIAPRIIYNHPNDTVGSVPRVQVSVPVGAT